MPSSTSLCLSVRSRARRTQSMPQGELGRSLGRSPFRAAIVAGLFMSRTNRPPMSIAQLKKFMDKKEAGDKIAVVVGTVTDDVRMFDVPKMTVCALRFSETARARITKAGGECLTFDQLALRAPTGENTLLLRGAKSHREAAKHFGAPGAHTDGRTRRRGAPCSASPMRWWRRPREPPRPRGGWGGSRPAPVLVGALWGWGAVGVGAAVPCVCGGAALCVRAVLSLLACRWRRGMPQR